MNLELQNLLIEYLQKGKIVFTVILVVICLSICVKGVCYIAETIHDCAYELDLAVGRKRKHYYDYDDDDDDCDEDDDDDDENWDEEDDI